jgi:hypothetical protein
MKHHDAGWVRDFARYVDSSAELFVFTREAEWLFVDGAAFEIRELSCVLRIREASEYRSGPEVAIRGGDRGDDPDEERRACEKECFSLFYFCAPSAAAQYRPDVGTSINPKFPGSRA